MANIFSDILRPVTGPVLTAGVSAPAKGVRIERFVITFDDPDGSEYILTFDDPDGSDYILIGEIE